MPNRITSILSSSIVLMMIGCLTILQPSLSMAAGASCNGIHSRQAVSKASLESVLKNPYESAEAILARTHHSMPELASVVSQIKSQIRNMKQLTGFTQRKAQEILSDIAALEKENYPAEDVLQMTFKFAGLKRVGGGDDTYGLYDRALLRIQKIYADIQRYEDIIGMKSVPLPLFGDLSKDTLARIWGTGLMPIGLLTENIFADGRMYNMTDFFIHDLEHYRRYLQQEAGMKRASGFSKQDMRERRKLQSQFLEQFSKRADTLTGSEKEKVITLWFFLVHERDLTFINYEEFKDFMTSEKKATKIEFLMRQVNEKFHPEIDSSQNTIKEWNRIWEKMEEILKAI